HGLTVVVRVDVDPARRDQEAVGVDFALAGPELAADRRDAVAIDGDVARKGRLAGAVDDLSAVDDDVVHRGRSLKFCAMMRRWWPRCNGGPRHRHGLHEFLVRLRTGACPELTERSGG